MTPDQISKLPHELRKAAELCEKGNDVTSNEFWERFDALPLALTWCLQVVGMRDEQMRLKDEYIALFRTAEATIATLKQEAADDALHNKFRDEVFDKYEAQVATLTRELKKFGRCLPECGSITWCPEHQQMENSGFPCDCGFAALSHINKKDHFMNYEVAADKVSAGDFRVEAINHSGDGEVFVAIFSGPDAEQRANEYAQFKNNR